MLKNALYDSTVLVAGGAGFIGSALVRELLPLCKAVVIFDNFIHGSIENLQDLEEKITIIHGDALEKASLNKAFRDNGVDYVFNCIGDTFVPDAYQYPTRFFDINLYANQNILEVAHDCEVKRILYVSSTEVYGELSTSTADETTPLAPVNTYAVSKLASDRLCYTYHIEHGTPVVIARIFNSYGPRETHPYIIPEIIEQLSCYTSLRLGNIRAMRDFTYVHDTARALIAILCSELPDGDVVNVGSGRAYSIEEIALLLADIMGAEGVDIKLDESRLRRKDIDLFCCNNHKLLSLTDWKPTVKLRQGLEMTVDWYRCNGDRWCWQPKAKMVSGY